MDARSLPVRDERGRFVWTPQKTRERRDLRHWRKNRVEVSDALARAATGCHLLARHDRGTVYSHPGVTRHALALRDACWVRSEGSTLTDGELAALGWIAAADLGLSQGGGVVIAHAELARLVGCSVRTAGTRVRRLVALGLLYRLPHFQPIGLSRHLRGPCVYALTPWVRGLLTAGKFCQAGEKDPDPEKGIGAPRSRPAAARGAGDAPAAGPKAENELYQAPEPKTGQTREATSPATSEAGAGVPEAPEGVRGAVAWARLAKRLQASLGELVAQEATRAQEAARSVPAALVRAWAGLGREEARREAARRLDPGLSAAVEAAMGPAAADAVDHPPRCVCGPCSLRRQLDREARWALDERPAPGPAVPRRETRDDADPSAAIAAALASFELHRGGAS